MDVGQRPSQRLAHLRRVLRPLETVAIQGSKEETTRIQMENNGQRFKLALRQLGREPSPRLDRELDSPRVLP